MRITSAETASAPEFSLPVVSSSATTQTIAVTTETTTPEITTTTAEITTETETTTTPETTATTTTVTTTPPVTTTTAATTTTITTTPAPVTTTVSLPVSNIVNGYNTLNYAEQKGFWFTYLEWGTMMKGKTKSEFTQNINEAFDNVVSLGFNTVYVQVRAFGDAYYKSELYPSGEQFDGQIGGEMSYDPLSVIIKSAHDRGLSVHAWINPMRIGSDSQIKAVSADFLYKQWYNSDLYNGEYIVKSADKWYLNPCYNEPVDLITAGVREIVGNYNVDGIQVDDYFYPTESAEFDKSAYKQSGTTLTLSDWRKGNVNRMVKKIYNAVHETNPDAVFGISPQGLFENNTEISADIYTWATEKGYCDYILPQVYFGFENSTAPYAQTIESWSNLVTNPAVKLVTGLSPYKIGLEDTWAGGGKNEWIENTDILARQIEAAKSLKNYSGYALYRYDSIFNPARDVAKQVDKEIENIKK